MAAAFFRVEAVIRLGFINPACITKACEWLPNRKHVQPVKIKDLNFNRDDFTKRGKTESECQFLSESTIHSLTIIRKH